MNKNLITVRVGVGLAVVTLALMGTTAFAQEQLIIAGPGGTFQAALEETVIPRFEAEHGVDVIYTAGRAANLLAQIETQREAPQIDIILGTDSSHYSAIKLGVVEPLDPATLTNYADVYDFAKAPENMGVMYGFQTLGVQYNTEVFAANGWEPPTSWNDLWDPKYKDHVILSSVPSGYAMTFLGLLGILEGGTSAPTDAVWARLEELAPNVLAFPSAAAELDQMFANGGGWIAPNGSGRVSALAATGVPVAMVIPEEGAALNPNWMDVIKNAPNMEMAMLFIDAMLSPEAQYDVATKMELGPINQKVELSPEEAASVPFGPDVVSELIPVDVAPLEDDLPAITDRFTRLIAR